MSEIDINKIEDELIKFSKNLNEKKNIDLNLKNTNEKIEKIRIKINTNKEKILRENELKAFSSQAIGSVYLYNKLNEKESLFIDNQFNKIIRFLDHIENKEKNYRKLYLECTSKYLSSPSSIPVTELKSEKEEINNCYKILLVLVKEVNGDKVKFNKVYNSIEDAGLFMSIPEKMNQQYLSQISIKLDNVIKGLKVIFQSLEETNRSLREIEGNTAEISYNMYDISNHLWDISYSLDKL
jgi:hypothetical protein